MPEIQRLIQKPFPGVEIVLFDLDLSPYGGPTKYFTNYTREDGNKIVWRGNEYEPVALEATGYGKSGNKPIRPTLKLGNASTDGTTPNGMISALAAQYGDFVGCTLTRWRTYRQFLDDGEAADPATHFPIERYRITSKTEESPIMIQFELAMRGDQDGLQLPKGVMVQKYCRWTYRVWDAVAEEFVYTNVTCPYTGEDMFDENGEPTEDPTQDKCSKRLGTGCRARFGTTAPLPFGGFPGMLRVTRR